MKEIKATLATIQNPKAAFYQEFKNVNSEAGIIRLVCDLVYKHEEQTDDYRVQAEAALLSALCIRIYRFEGKANCKDELSAFLFSLSLSDRTKQNTRPDKLFAAWKELWPEDEAVIAYDLFQSLPPKDQYHVIQRCHDLLVDDPCIPLL